MGGVYSRAPVPQYRFRRSLEPPRAQGSGQSDRYAVPAMVATIARAATADYYINSQASHRPADEYYLSGEEPDGVWWNPSGLFPGGDGGMASGRTIDSADFHKLYRGFHPRTGEALTRNVNREDRCPAYDMTFNADKTVSALWAVAPPELRADIEKAHDDAVGVALEDVLGANCGHTRVQGDNGGIEVVPADFMAALFRHGASRSNDPHLHTHCVILNLARTHRDGKWRTLHGHPLFSWQKAAGATYRAELAWLLRERLGIETEVHGEERQYTRIKGIPRDLVKGWSKRDIQIADTAARMGVGLRGNGALHGAIQRVTRAAKEHGIDPEQRHLNWAAEAAGHIRDIPGYVESLTGRELGFTGENRREIAARLANIPAELTKHESVFHYTDLVERAANAASGLLSRERRQRAFEELMRTETLLELDRPDTSRDAGVRLNHSRPFTAAHTVETEARIHELAGRLFDTDLFGIAPETVAARVRDLKAAGYPIDGEQVAAIEAATRAGQIAIIEGAAGSGKTTTLRPIADLYRERGYDIVATSVSWRVTLELGSDLDAPNRCVDKLAAGIRTGRIRLGPRTVIVVDEAGQLSSLQAARILGMAEASRAKVIFAGDTQQQQPVEAGPGLRLIRDVAGSTRVDTIRRQKPDVEDILVAVHGEDREAARVRAAIAPAREKQRILDGFEALPDAEKGKVRPWQVVASERFRDGEAAEAIAAYHGRGRIHIDGNLARTFERLIGDWDRLRTGQPDKTSAVIAYSRAEVKTLSHLMRERILAGYDGPRYTVQACRGREPGAKPEPLELAVGDIVRTGAANFGKHLFNGTHLEILELREDPPAPGNPGVPRVWIGGRTDRGRIVRFHHDEIRDYHGNIRLDYGYAMTMSAAQGITVDRAFVFANQKPSRETIYPAMTRHRERLDVYVDRKPVELDVRHRRGEDVDGDPVTDRDVLDYLARNWSRSRKKEAARDYMSERMRERYFRPERSPEPEVERDIAREAPPPARRIDAEGLDAAQWLAANDAGDGRLSDIAARIRYGEIRVRHGLAARTIGEACRRLNASLAGWDEARRETGNAAVAMDPRFRQDLGEAGAVLRTVKPFLRGDPLHARVLREHGGIGIADLETLASAHRRALSIRDMSAGERRRLDPGFAAAAPPRARESAAAREISDAFRALEPRSREQTVDAAIEPPADLWEGWEQRHGRDESYDWEIAAGAGHVRDEAHDREIASGEIGRYPYLDAGDLSREPPGEFAQAPAPEADARDETLTAAERIAALEQSWVRHRDEAVRLDRHPFAAPGWAEIHRGMREIAALPDVAPGDSANLARSIRIADDWLARHGMRAGEERTRDTGVSPGPAPSHRPAAAPATARRVEEHSRRLNVHFDAAETAGLHPFDAPGWDELERQLRAFPGLADLSSEHRAYVGEQIAAIDAARRDRAAGAAQTLEPEPLQPDRAAERLYRQHRERYAAHMQSVLDADEPDRVDLDAYERLRREGLALLDTPGLPAAARDHLSHAYGIERQAEVTAMHLGARRALVKQGTSPYEVFDRRLGRHLDDAASKGLHPYLAPGWEELAREARKLRIDSRIAARQLETVDRVLAHYDSWLDARRQVSRTQEKDRSRGMSF